MKMSRKLKKVFNIYNILIFVCIIVILVAMFILFKPEDKVIVDGVEIVQSDLKETDEITEEQAKKMAIKQFKNLGEDVKAAQLKISKIRRGEIEYYYITSPKNSMEIRIKGGNVERVNSVLIEE